jgi:hypothetical protein
VDGRIVIDPAVCHGKPVVRGHTHAGSTDHRVISRWDELLRASTRIRSDCRRYPRRLTIRRKIDGVGNYEPLDFPNRITMPEVFVAAYKSPATRAKVPADAPEIALQFYAVAANDNFPFDVADDPSFFSARQRQGPVTWGVCRADVRRLILPGDWMVFFCSSPLHRGRIAPSRRRRIALSPP